MKPCRGEKEGNFISFHLRDKEVVVVQFIIKSTILVGKLKSHSQSQEALINIVISFLKINFKHNITCLAYFVVYMVNNLLSYKSIVTSSPLWDETTLKQANNPSK